MAGMDEREGILTSFSTVKERERRYSNMFFYSEREREGILTSFSIVKEREKVF